MKICLFEDAAALNFLPLTYLRAVFELRVGCFELREKIAHAYDIEPSLCCRSFLADKVRERLPSARVNELTEGSTLYLNGRLIADASLSKNIPLEGPEQIFTVDNEIVAYRTLDSRNVKFHEDGIFDPTPLRSLPKRAVSVLMAHYPWDLVHENGQCISHDLTWVKGKGRQEGGIHPSAVLLNEEGVTIRPTAIIDPGVILDAREGPIVIDEGVKVLPQATIIGPAYIGPRSTVKVGAKIYGSTSIGPMCKVGGEVESSIIHGYSNKQHEGFLGHAYVGEWCNLGADTNNSDLKNNYGSVRVTVGGREIDTGEQFVGLFLADHAKTGINTMFNTGTVVGVASNVFGPGYPPKYIPSFSWYDTAKGPSTYDLKKAMTVAERVMARRNVVMTETDRSLLRNVFEQTAEERTVSPT